MTVFCPDGVAVGGLESTAHTKAITSDVLTATDQRRVSGVTLNSSQTAESNSAPRLVDAFDFD